MCAYRDPASPAVQPFAHSRSSLSATGGARGQDVSHVRAVEGGAQQHCA
ncbi:hypothetical protein X759_33090 [Mesorhizobium sp. LSHC420B00]|nr:hypothetical protein X759_33090 [Mesorhizobium sp. LSHC420B00]